MPWPQPVHIRTFSPSPAVTLNCCVGEYAPLIPRKQKYCTIHRTEQSCRILKDRSGFSRQSRIETKRAGEKAARRWILSACGGGEAQREAEALGRVEDNAGPRTNKYKPTTNAIRLDVWRTASQPLGREALEKLPGKQKEGERSSLVNEWACTLSEGDFQMWLSVKSGTRFYFIPCTLSFAPLLGAEARGCNYRSGLWAFRTTERLIFCTGLHLSPPLKIKKAILVARLFKHHWAEIQKTCSVKASPSTSAKSLG